MTRAFWGLVAKDLRVHFSDARAFIIGLAAPIAIASFFGVVFSGQGPENETARVAVRIVDLDGSAVSKRVLDGVRKDKMLDARETDERQAREAVRRGAAIAAVVIPKGFGVAAGRAFFAGGAKPSLTILFDPSRAMEMSLVRGLMTQHVMESISQEMFGGATGRQVTSEALGNVDRMEGLSADQRGALRDLLQGVDRLYRDDTAAAARPAAGMPYTVAEEAITARPGIIYNPYAHAFAGMGVQFVLFAAIEAGVLLLLERQRGVWRRIRTAPLSRSTLLGARTASGAIIALATLLAMFAFAMVVFKVRVFGSLPGFLGVAVAFAIMSATFGLLLASLGKTPGATRGIAIFVVLIMVMLGGAWAPTFIFPAWMQRATLVVPTRWGVDGLQTMSWRGLGFEAAVPTIAVLLGYSLLFAVIAVWRFRWEEA